MRRRKQRRIEAHLTQFAIGGEYYFQFIIAGRKQTFSLKEIMQIQQLIAYWMPTIVQSHLERGLK